MLKEYFGKFLIPITKLAILNGLIWALITKKLTIFLFVFAGHFFGLNIIGILLTLDKNRKNKEHESKRDHEMQLTEK